MNLITDGSDAKRDFLRERNKFISAIIAYSKKAGKKNLLNILRFVDDEGNSTKSQFTLIDHNHVFVNR